MSVEVEDVEEVGRGWGWRRKKNPTIDVIVGLVVMVLPWILL